MNAKGKLCSVVIIILSTHAPKQGRGSSFYRLDMNGSNTTCYLSEKEDKAIFVTKLVVVCISLITNVVAIGTLIFFKSYRRFVFRLVLSLLISSLLGVVVQILELIPLNHSSYPIAVRDGWLPACAAFGFLDQVTIWMSNCVIIWIVLFLCRLMTLLHDKINMFTSDVTVAEAVGICLCFLLPFTFNWIPFTTDYFGPSGHWCWIKLTKADTCEDSSTRAGVVYMFVFYYGPLLLIMLLTSIVSVVAVVVWCKNLKNDSIKKMIFIVIYPIVFDVVGCIVTANRIEAIRRATHKEGPNFGLWMAHAIADPARTLLPAFFFPVSVPYSCYKRYGDEQSSGLIY